MKSWLLGAALVAILAAIPAEAMTVAEFLAKARALQRQGMAAAFSPDVALLRTEMRTIGEAYRADLQAARAAGRPPHSCPPAQRRGQIDRDAFIAELERIPEAQRRTTSMRDAFYGIMRRRYPCG